MDALDIVGNILWYAIFLTPMITIIISLKYGKQQKIVMRMVVGLLYGLAFSVIFFLVSMGIFLRSGLGPA
jgi:hypothetical protein